MVSKGKEKLKYFRLKKKQKQAREITHIQGIASSIAVRCNNPTVAVGSGVHKFLIAGS